MSGSSSPSPPHNLSPANLVTISEATNLRPQPSGESIAEVSTGEQRQSLTVRLSPPAQDAQVAGSSSGRRRPLVRPAEEPAEEEPMAKRIRRSSPEVHGRHQSHSSPSPSDSQDEHSDNEMDTGKVDQSDPLPSTSAPPKKKRTRTLTTPHQSAVLHALLAQSRFPTTAMREEVGNSIGLSARKVQIWFQNQRQKARRPRSQSDAPSRPQYEPFPSASDSVSHNVREFDYGLNYRPYMHPGSHLHILGGSSETSARLLGPGMPGPPPHDPETQAQTQRPARPPISGHPRDDVWQSAGHPYQRLPSPPPYGSPRMYPLPGARPATSQPSSWRERDPSRILPPPVSTRPSGLSYASRRMPPSMPHSYLPPRQAFAPPRSISPEPRFAHQPPGEPSPRHLMHFPPPFTLQPSPQWDESSYTVFPRPGSSAWSRPTSRSTRGRSTSPITSRREHMGSTLETSSDIHHGAEDFASRPLSPPRSLPRVSSPPSRSGRYDPVRATFVPFSTPSVSPTLSPAHPAGGDGDERSDQNSKSPAHEKR